MAVAGEMATMGQSAWPAVGALQPPVLARVSKPLQGGPWACTSCGMGSGGAGGGAWLGRVWIPDMEAGDYLGFLTFHFGS